MSNAQQWTLILLGAVIVAVALEVYPPFGGALLALLVFAMVMHIPH